MKVDDGINGTEERQRDGEGHKLKAEEEVIVDKMY
jgi:hypothetical protein